MKKKNFTCGYCGSNEVHDRRRCHQADAANRERMRRNMCDPEFRAKQRAGLAQRYKDPARNPLVLLTESERADYDVLRKAGYRRAEAFLAIGRADLNKGARA